MRQVLPASRVPRRHVLLHAVGVAGRFAGGKRGAGRGDAAVEAVFVEFLFFHPSQLKSPGNDLKEEAGKDEGDR